MEKTLTLNGTTARKLYPQASSEFKTLLEENFSKEFFSQKITDRVKTIQDAFEVTGLTPGDLFASTDTVDERAYKTVKLIAKALNEDWTPDWNDKKQPKYFPYFFFNGSGFALRFVSDYYQLSLVGSRLCFRSRELAEYAATQFVKEYNGFLSL